MNEVIVYREESEPYEEKRKTESTAKLNDLVSISSVNHPVKDSSFKKVSSFTKVKNSIVSAVRKVFTKTETRDNSNKIREFETTTDEGKKEEKQKKHKKGRMKEIKKKTGKGIGFVSLFLT